MATVTKDFRIKAGLVVEGTNGTINDSDIITEDAITGGTQTNISVTYNPTTKVVDFVAENGVADSDTDDLTEGSTNQYFTDARAQAAVATDISTAVSDHNDLTTGVHGVSGDVVGTTDSQILSGKTLKGKTYFVDSNGDGGTNNSIAKDAFSGNFVIQSGTDMQITTVDGDIVLNADGNSYLGSASSSNKIATTGNLQDHSDSASGVHGVTGTVVGTSDTQNLSNKTITDSLHFKDGANDYSAIHPSGTNLNIDGSNDIILTTNTGDIVLNADGSSYVTSASAGNEIATHAYVDNAVSGLAWKEAVNLFATSNVPLTGNTETVVIDGHAALDGTDDGYRLLLTGQTTNTENGIYVYSDDGETYTLTRSEDADTVAELVGAAVFVMEGTQYGSTSWVQANHYANSFDDLDWTQFSGTGSVTAGSGITVDGLEISIDRSTVDTWYDAAGAASTALQDAKDYADALDTDDVAEGSTNQYYTTARAKTDAAALLTGATKTNITITGDGDGLTITAENGVADSDTDDLTEGSTNLYFTDARAVTALEAVVPNFEEIEIDSLAKQVAATVSAPTASVPVVAFAFAKADYRSAKFLVKVAYSTHTEVSEVLLTLDTSDNIAITEYAVVGTNGSASVISARITGSNVELTVSPTNASSTVTVMGTLLV
jgi:hypothetical protein